MTGTLICDEDGLYDPRNFNDRLLLGMKGRLTGSRPPSRAACQMHGDPTYLNAVK
jgi:hypothetical protein